MKSFSPLLQLLFLSVSLLAATPQVSIPVKAVTAATGNDVDDCAIWVHPVDPGKSVVIVNDKGPATAEAGLYVYALDGTLLQKLPVYRPQNPDLRYNVVMGHDTMDLLVCVDREASATTYNKVRVFRINAQYRDASDGFLTEITDAAGIPTGLKEPYGHSLYKRASDGALFSVVSNYGKTDFTQIRLSSNGSGGVTGTIVRTWGKNDIRGDVCEGICCDDRLGYIYICDEDSQVIKYEADPDKNINTPVSLFAKGDGIVADREGIDIYECSDSTGYILLSSQGNNQIKVYDRITNAFIGTLTPEKMKDCDGLDVTATPLGSAFPHGMAALHLGSTAGSSFGFYDWDDIVSGLSLATPCNAVRPSGSGATAITARHHGETTSSNILLSFDTRSHLLGSATGMVSVSLFTLDGRLISEPYVNTPVNGMFDLALPRTGRSMVLIACTVDGHTMVIPGIIR